MRNPVGLLVTLEAGPSAEINLTEEFTVSRNSNGVQKPNQFHAAMGK